MSWSTRLVAGGAAVTVGLVGLAVYAVLQVPEARSDVWLEVARAAIQAIAIGVVGGFLAYLLRQHELERDRRQRLDESRLLMLREVVSAYNRAKAARRVLRAAGFPTPLNDRLTVSQIDAFEAAMRALNDAQLDLERIRREVRAGAGRFVRRDHLCAALSAAERYFGQIVTEWERQGPLIRVGDVEALRASDGLIGFLAKAHGPDRRSTFVRGAARHLDFVERRMRAEIGASS